jgi:phosphoglycerol transferase MdoB-like AlkP superfamily enzyme
MAMIGNASDMTKFTTVNIWLIINLNLIIMLAYTIIVFFLNIKINFKLTRSFAIGFACIGIFASFIVFPAFTVKVYSVFDIKNSESLNSFTDNAKFEDLNFIPYFVESATNLFTYSVKEPDDYSEESVKNILKPADDIQSASENINVIYIMSESFADFRVFESENKNGELDSVYTNFDIMRKEGFGGTCVVPTFGGYTSRSEFETIFGLPLKSIGTPALPSNKLKNEPEENISAIPDFYKASGYDTTYIHPFSRTFYNRDEIYSKYGFNNMIFDDNLELYIPAEQIKHFRKYISDETVFDCITDKIKNSDKPEYIVAMTMQNHVPYSNPVIDNINANESIKIENEYEYYLDGIRETDKAIGHLKDQLADIGEKCIVIFIGDHFPFFISENNKYNELQIDSQNCYTLYEQRYFIWANFDFDKSILEKYDKISLFYIPNIITEIQGLPKNQIINTVLDELDNSPVYSQFLDKDIQKNDILDMLTYDLIIDGQFALK